MPLSQELQSRQNFVERVRDLQHHGGGSEQAQAAPGPDHDRLNDDEVNANDTERHDQQAEQQREPWHCAPASSITDHADEDFEHVRRRA